MDPCKFYRQVADRAARTPARIGQAPLRAAQLTTAEPGVTPYESVYEEGRCPFTGTNGGFRRTRNEPSRW